MRFIFFLSLAFSMQAIQSFTIGKLPKQVLVRLRRHNFDILERRFETPYITDMLNQNHGKEIRKKELKDIFRPYRHHKKNERFNLPDDFGKQVEAELKHIAMKSGSELEKVPYVMTKGKNDYLVMSADDDPFIDIVPNDIYYQQEKKCANWFEGCNTNGVSVQLLQKIYSPYK